MRPSVPVTLEPGSERGVPWGRDLYTFVTSAAGHMMRTLQKPRKNRPSKRQVNHRRFLHNMIQRKFADIEAANHRLASAIYFKEEDKNAASEKPETSVQSDSAAQTNPPPHAEQCGLSKPANDVSVGSQQPEDSEKKQLNPGHLWKRHPKSQAPTCTTGKNNLSTGRRKRAHENPPVAEFTFMDSPKGKDCQSEAAAVQPEPYEDSNQTKAPSSLWEAQTVARDASPSFSPALSPLSIDSCDFSIQMFTDISACTHSQRSIADMEESQWADIMELFSGGTSDEGSCTEVEACLEGTCLCQGDAGRDVRAEELPFPHQSHGLRNDRRESEDLCCERGEYSAYSCQRDRRTDQAGNTHFSSFTPARAPDASINHHSDASELQTYRSPLEQSRALLGGCENHLHFTPFEGVAQSFCAPPHHPEQRSIATPPRDDDWLFTDILTDARGC